jgi:hypothetical protein
MPPEHSRACRTRESIGFKSILPAAHHCSSRERGSWKTAIILFLSLLLPFFLLAQHINRSKKFRSVFQDTSIIILDLEKQEYKL